MQCHFINFSMHLYTFDILCYVLQCSNLTLLLTSAYEDEFNTSHSFDILVCSQHKLLFHLSGFKYIANNHRF